MKNFPINSISLLFFFYSLISAELQAPVFSIPDTVFETRLNVSMYSPDSAWLYYTTDGSIPDIFNNPSSKLASSNWKFDLDSSVTIKAIAMKKDTTAEGVVFYDKSSIMVVTYTKKLRKPSLWVKHFDFYVDSFYSNDTLLLQFTHIPMDSCTFIDSITFFLYEREKDASIYYTTDGSDPSEKSLIFKDSLVMKNSSVLKFIAIKSGYVNSAIIRCKIIKLSVKVKDARNPIPNKKYEKSVNEDSVSKKMNGNAEIAIITLTGRVLKNVTYNNLRYSINHLAKGTYLLEYKNGNWKSCFDYYINK